MTNIIYIIGWLRSGSTLLGSTLAGHPEIVHIGESVNLWTSWERGSPCACGAPISQCLFWNEVLSAVCEDCGQEDVSSIVEEAEALRKHFARLRNFPLTWFKYRKSYPYALGMQRFEEIMCSVYRHSSRVGKAAWVVDSSKTPATVVPVLRNYPAARLIHLVRDPVQVAMSERKQGNWSGVAEEDMPPVRSPVQSALWWTLINRSARHITRAIPSNQVLILKYEELVADLPSTWYQIASWLDIDASLGPIDNSKIVVNNEHSAAGNPCRFQQGEVAIKIATRPHHLNWSERLVMDAIAGRESRRYGYMGSDH